MAHYVKLSEKPDCKFISSSRTNKCWIFIHSSKGRLNVVVNGTEIEQGSCLLIINPDFEIGSLKFSEDFKGSALTLPECIVVRGDYPVGVEFLESNTKCPFLSMAGMQGRAASRIIKNYFTLIKDCLKNGSNDESDMEELHLCKAFLKYCEYLYSKKSI